MKPFKVFLSILCIAVAGYAAAMFFSQNSVEVKTSPVSQDSYTPSILVTGTVTVAKSGTSFQTDVPASASVGNAAYVTVLIGESNISDVKVGQKASVTGNGFKDKTYSATVSKIGDKAQKNSALVGSAVAVEVTLKIDQPDSALKSGFTAKAKIFTDEASEKTIVPYSAVLQDNGGEYVYVCKDNKAEKKYISTALELENGYEVLRGVKAGDIVVITPLDIKSSGQKISFSQGEDE